MGIEDHAGAFVSFKFGEMIKDEFHDPHGADRDFVMSFGPELVFFGESVDELIPSGELKNIDEIFSLFLGLELE